VGVIRRVGKKKQVNRERVIQGRRNVLVVGDGDTQQRIVEQERERRSQHNDPQIDLKY